ncbi:MAG TPA: hypothetical protein VGR37_12285 [Longimicrobiaceae bacterium]|nr:hypothetical protein [Longimicrobiaceae bacterium]
MRALLLLAGLTLSVAAPGPGSAQAAAGSGAPHVRVHAHVLLIDRAEARRIGLRYAQAGGGRILADPGRGRRGRGGVGAVGEVAGIPFSAFVELAHDRRLVRSDTRMQVLALSGSTAALGSGSLRVGPYGTARAQGPELVVTPTVQDDGRVRLEVRARLRDEVTDPYGYGVDASPVDAATVVVVRSGDEATVGNVQTSTQREDAALLRWEDASGSRDVLVVLRPEIEEP